MISTPTAPKSTSNLLPLKDMAKLLLAGIPPEDVAHMHGIRIEKLAELLGEGQRLRELVEEGQKKQAEEGAKFDFDGQWREAKGIQRDLKYEELEAVTLDRAIREMRNLGNRISMRDLMGVLTVCIQRGKKSNGSLVEINIGSGSGGIGELPEYLKNPEKPMITVNEQGQVLQAGGRDLTAMPSMRLTEVLKQALPSGNPELLKE
jgi:hypothetical protein